MPRAKPDQLWKVGELAARTGLTVRTLHHYDAIGLLSPSGRTDSSHGSGHRLYTAADVARLQQILSLKMLGFGLEQIREYLLRDDYDPRWVIRVQLQRVRDQADELKQLADRLTALADALDKAEAVSADEFLQTIEEMTMIEKMYTPEQMKQFQELGKLVGPEEIRAVQEAWTALLADVRASRDLDPACPDAQALARRWEELTERTLRGYQAFPELRQAIAENYKQGKFEGFDRAPQAADMAFIERVRAARKAAGES